MTSNESGMNPKDLVGSRKVPLSLVPGAAIAYAAMAMGDGAAKYGPYNWRDKDVQAMTYAEAAMRHILAWIDGEECARDSGLPHLAHALATIAILVDAVEGGFVVDNRPRVGPAADVIERFNARRKDADQKTSSSVSSLEALADADERAKWNDESDWIDAALTDGREIKKVMFPTPDLRRFSMPPLEPDQEKYLANLGYQWPYRFHGPVDHTGAYTSAELVEPIDPAVADRVIQEIAFGARDP